MNSCCVIGGGITGLCCGYQLAKQKIKSVLIDPSTEPEKLGGVILTKRINGFQLECGPNVLLDKAHLKTLLEELGLNNEITYPIVDSYKQYVWYNGRPEIVPKSPPKLFKTPLLELSKKLALPYKLFASGVLKPAAEDESVYTFMSRLIGEQGVLRIIDPALKGIYGGNPEDLSAASVFPELWAHARTGAPLIGYLKKKKKTRAFVLRAGMSSLCQKLRERGAEHTEYLSDSVEQVKKAGQNGSYEIVTRLGKNLVADRVYITTAGPASGQFIRTLDEPLADKLNTVRYSSLIVVHVSVDANELQNLSHMVNSFGILFPRDSSNSLLGVMYNSVLFPHLAPTGKHLLTVCLGGIAKQKLLESSDSQIEQMVRQSLKQLLGHSVIDCLAITRWPRAIPQYELGHGELVKHFRRVESQNPGIYFLGSDSAGVGVPDRVRQVMENSCLK